MMPETPDLDRAWTLAQATEALRARGVRLTLRAGDYRLNYAVGGMAKSEYVTDDLHDALTVGYAMAENRPTPPKAVRRRRRTQKPYVVRANGEIRLRRNGKKRQSTRQPTPDRSS
jgi:hypothetical protein